MRPCSICGNDVADDARFCATCGAGVDAPPGREARKTVTVVFADVTGSTALGEQLDPESLRRVMARYFETASRCFEGHGATVEKFIGDAVMAVFGVPVAHEDDALRAAQAASELRSSLSRLNAELEQDFAVSLQVRIGVNTGEVVVGTRERLATGDAVNVAARLEQSAAPGEILLGAETLRLARDAIEVEPVESISVKGKAHPTTAYRLRRVVEGAPAFQRRFDAPLVGRREELERVHAAFAKAVARRRGLLFTVLGEPGIGKSRLAREISAELRPDAVVLAGRCLPYGEGITFWPLREIFASAGAEGELDAALAGEAPEDIFWAVRKSVERRARERPLVLVIEDIHWAEATLLDLIEYLADWTREAPLFLFCLARPELIDKRPAWDGGRSNAETLRLDPLGKDESEQLIDGLIGESGLADAVRARIGEVAAGNPLFVEQLVASVAEGGRVDEVPSTIQAVLSARLDTLPEAERDVLERASVIGAEFEWDALTRLDRDRRRPSGTLLLALVRKELITPHEAIDDTFSFRHILIRDAAYEQISKERRAELHERLAEWLDGREESQEVVGYHLEQAYRSLADLRRPGDRGRILAHRAAERLSASGLRAKARGDTDAARNLLQRAAALLSPDDRRRLRLLPTLARAFWEGGQLEDADATFAEAVERGQAAGEAQVAADARVALVELRFLRPAKTGIREDDVLRELYAATRVFENLGDKAGLGRALSLSGKLRLWRGEAKAAIDDFERAASHARAAGESADEAESLQILLGTMLRGPMPLEDVLRRLDRFHPQDEINRRLQVRILDVGALVEAMRGRFDTSRGLLGRARALAVEYGLDVLLDSHVRPAIGEVELLAGDAAAAERELRLSCEGLERVGDFALLSSVTPLLVDALIEQGRDEEALALTDRWHVDGLTTPEDVDAQVGWRRVRAKLLARLGELDAAERLSREAVALASGTDLLLLHARAVADLGDVLHLAGRPEESSIAWREAKELYEAKGAAAAAVRLRARIDASRVDSSP